MIASLSGTVVDLGINGAVIECAGVGYAVAATPATLATLRRGESARLLTTLVLRENSVTLYGFADPESRELFDTLQGVSGVGPKVALAVESVFSPEELAAAIGAGDAKSIQRVPGVGKRMAERMIVELKDKLPAPTFAEPDGEAPAQAAGEPAGAAGPVAEALEGLGFTSAAAAKAARAAAEANPDADVPAVLRAALRSLGPGA
ncbi:Holliday junction DNA helicase RuvA [Corynebacterium otitidis ATCC 51513]|uniref:Holliday junction branch migration complex subunit RuvA n=2 Tax=Corynebacterium otitidis TaxID=29321 RepID=K0Z6R4_9CORY|nr:Holliday junction branch migration protein RuvA [Corynebacterium otitidis]EJZ83060.1 Holliday junction DNA helicase RuvA [Corynebacterium otitidis ATCC 51513]